MPRICGICISVVTALVSCFSQAFAQSAPNTDGSAQNYTLKLPVDEVVLTFHASDAEGKPVNDIRSSEVRLWDNGAPPRRIVTFDALLDRALRVGILIDTSESMKPTLALNKAIAQRYIQRLFRRKSDDAFVEGFGSTSRTIQPWSDDPSLLRQGIQGARIGAMNPVGGTAVFDAIFRACFYGFSKSNPTATGNIILLFSDGEDNAGQITIQEALRACQGSNTAIYAFYVPPQPGAALPGPKNLRALSSRTGGRVFFADDSEEAIWNDLTTIESEMRNQYRLVYKPANFKHDGSFHEIEIQPPDRVTRVEVRTGYFAPVR